MRGQEASFVTAMFVLLSTKIAAVRNVPFTEVRSFQKRDEGS